MIVIGITGPTGAGKTTALQELELLGGAIIDCDAVYHELLKSDIALQNELEAAFGSLKDGDGAIDRKKLGAVVFRDPAALARLDGLVLPYIRSAVAERVRRAEADGAAAAAIDGITLIETGLSRLCDTTVAVLAPAEDRIHRICLREGIDEAYARARVTAQKPDSFYRQNCDCILFNDCADAGQFALRSRELFSRLLAAGEQA